MQNVLKKSIDDFRSNTCGPDVKIKDIMLKFNQLKPPIMLVIDGADRLLGTVTDGDVRRALLKGTTTTEDAVTECMHLNPMTGSVGENEKNNGTLWRTNSSSPFLPIVDKDNRVIEVMIATIVETASPKTALVMAGGFGRRLGERTKNTPKPLLEVKGSPILSHILDQLEAAGMEKIFISVHHLADQFETYLQKRQSRATITLLHEEAPLGTAGAISLLPADMNDDFLVINGDVMSSIDLNQFTFMHQRNQNDATIALAQHEVNIPYGVIEHSEDGTFIGVNEKPCLRHFVLAGIYYLSPVFKSLVKEGEFLDMPSLLNSGRSIGMKIGLFPIHEYWIDIGHPADFEAAQKDILK